MSTLPRPRRRGVGITQKERDIFLGELRKGWSPTFAAEACGFETTGSFYALRKRDEEFAAAWEEALETGTDRIRDEAHRRAVHGYRDFRLDKDGNEHELTVYSDKLLELELKKRDHSYRERTQLELTGAGGRPLEVGVRVEHDFAAILDTLEQAGVLSRGPAAAAVVAEARALLPTPADGEADLGAGRAPLPSD